MYKVAVKTYLITLLLLIASAMLTIFVSDPYMLFHKHWFHHGLMYKNMRIQDYGLIKHGKFDGIIIGTSMLENTSGDEASVKLGAEFANLSVSGSSYYERFKILDMALKTRKFKHIIMSVDYKFSKARDINNTFEPALYSFNSIKGKIAIYSTDKALKCIFLNQECDFIKFDLNFPKAWYKNKSFVRRFGGFENWLKYTKEDKQLKAVFEQLHSNKNRSDGVLAYKQIIDEEILPLFKHKDTTFSLLIPPYSALFWAVRKNNLAKLLEPYQYLAESTAQMPNVKIYWFYDEDFVFDIANYKDLIHYHHSFNSQQIDAIKNGTNILNVDNYKQKLKDFEQKIDNFDLQTYTDKISGI